MLFLEIVLTTFGTILGWMLIIILGPPAMQHWSLVPLPFMSGFGKANTSLGVVSALSNPVHTSGCHGTALFRVENLQAAGFSVDIRCGRCGTYGHLGGLFRGILR